MCSIHNNANDILVLKLDCSIWNFVAILYRTKDNSTSGLAAVNGRHLEILTSGTGSIYNSVVDFLDPENMGEAVGIFRCLSCIEPEILVPPV